ncbi:MAG TPA: hypothetical protein V6C69_05550 [Trichormus sp.]
MSEQTITESVEIVDQVPVESPPELMDDESDEAIFAEAVDEDGPELSVEAGHGPEPLSLKEAALILGKSIRALERSLSGKWGNKLPDGWSAIRRMVGDQEEWQILPPSDFRYEHILSALRRKEKESNLQRIQPEDLLRPFRAQFESNELKENGLLRELAYANKELAEQRKVHLEDLRTLLELQSSMRLLEVNTGETAKLKTELLEAQKDLVCLREQYKQFFGLPWWKRIFKRLP